jgi:hypothetical protein
MGDERRDGLREDVRALLAERIDSIAQLEALLLLHRTGQAAWDAPRLAGELRLELRSAEAELAVLASRGFLVLETKEGVAHWRYEPSSAALGRAVDGLARAYRERRVRVVEFLYSKPAVEKLRVFSDAFRLREDEPDG